MIISQPESMSLYEQLGTYPNINPNLLSVNWCWVRGGVKNPVLIHFSIALGIKIILRRNDQGSILFLSRTRLPQDRDPRHGNAPFFGIQMAPDCEGNIKLGDPVFISC